MKICKKKSQCKINLLTLKFKTKSFCIASYATRREPNRKPIERGPRDATRPFSSKRMFNFRQFLNGFIRNVFTSTGTKARYVRNSAKCINDHFWSRYENSEESFARIEALWFRSISEIIYRIT